MPTDVDNLTTLITQRKWLPIAGVIIFFLVRLLKSDTRIPITLTPRLRMGAAFLFGIVSAVIERYAHEPHPSWTDAIVGGVVSSVLAVLIHDGYVGALKGGAEPTLGLKWLLIPGAAPGPGKAASIPPVSENKETKKDVSG